VRSHPHVQPALSRLGSLLRQERARLQEQQPRLVRAVLRQVLPELPGLLHEIRLPAQRGSLPVGLPDDLGYERLYDALEQRVLQSITKRIEDAGGQCSQGLDALEVSMFGLQHVLAGQHDRLMHIKRQLRNDAVPSADADDYIQTA
jgi:hypothetical protein